MKILVLCTDYPSKSKVSSMYVHTRNKYYSEKGISVDVINFATPEDYDIDGINVYSLDSYADKLKNNEYDFVVSHAPNLRNHYRFLKKNGKAFDKIVFFFHGHEVLKINKVYPEPYSYVKRNKLKECSQNFYDNFKFRVWRKYFAKNNDKIFSIFVSEWMFDEFNKWVRPKKPLRQEDYSITYNCVDKFFEKKNYSLEEKCEYDFITVRSFLDGSKYCADLIVKLAEKHSDYKFCLVGKGEFFKHFPIPSNLTVIEKYLKHDEIISLLNKSRCALMPTRTDAQGLMACEMATYGIPLITSTIPVSKEIFSEFDNVGYINNDGDFSEFEQVFNNLLQGKEKHKKCKKYFLDKTVMKEIEVFNNLIK